MEIKDIRVQNLQALRAKYGKPRIIACDPEWTPNYVNQLLRGIGSFGNAAARKIEEGLKLPKGWLSQHHEPTDEQKAELLMIWETMAPDARVRYLKIGAALKDE